MAFSVASATSNVREIKRPALIKSAEKITDNYLGATNDTLTDESSLPIVAKSQGHDTDLGIVQKRKSQVERIKQSWIGTVEAVSQDEIIAVLEDSINPSSPRERVVLLREKVASHDKELVVPGAVFYWNIGYLDGVGLPRRPFSKIRFRRLPVWTATEIEQAEREAAKYAEFFAGN